MARRVLAIESATDWLSVALLEGEDVIDMRRSDARMQHAAALLPAIDAVLTDVGTNLEKIDAIAISTGPGSFTSLRIGLATVKGLGFRRDLEAVGVSTLEAMALAGLEGGTLIGAEAGIDSRVLTDAEKGTNTEAEKVEVVAVLDARRGEWYAGSWRGGVGSGRLPEARLAEGLYAPDRIAAALSIGRSAERSTVRSTPRSTAGSAAGLGSPLGPVAVVAPQPGGWRAALEASDLAVSHWIEGEAAQPSAAWVGRVGQRRLDAGEGRPVDELGARYLRRAEAEAQLLGGPVETGEIADLGAVSEREGGPRRPGS